MNFKKLLAMMRVAVLESSEVTTSADFIPISQRLRILSSLGPKRCPD
jgi:hypothetical protein